jgi:hypothetical protein
MGCCLTDTKNQLVPTNSYSFDLHTLPKQYNIFVVKRNSAKEIDNYKAL